MEKQNISGNKPCPENKEEVILLFINELRIRSLKSLSLIQKKLNFLCLEFDPYSQADMPQEVESILNEFNLMEYIENPFEFTNIILQMLNHTELELKKRMN